MSVSKEADQVLEELEEWVKQNKKKADIHLMTKQGTYIGIQTNVNALLAVDFEAKLRTMRELKEPNNGK